MNLKVQRFPEGHPLYSDAKDKEGYQATFGEMIDESSNHICYTMERRDTLTPEGCYPFTYYKSPANKTVVPLFHNIPGFSFVEVHIANYPFEVKGCTAVGTEINTFVPMLVSSGKAFAILMDFLNMNAGTITYETLQNQTT